MINLFSAQAALSILGGATGGSGGNGMSAMTNYRMVDANKEQRFTAYVDQPTVKRELAYFAEKIATIESADDLINDWQLKSFVLQAFGLEDLQQSNHMLKRILTDDLTDNETALAYRMNDERFRDIATTLRLDQGVDRIKSAEVIGAITERYLVNGFEKQVGQDSLATRQALYFERKIGAVTNIYQIMADPTLKEVARVAGGLPTDIARLDFDRQAELYERTVDIEKLKDEDYVSGMIDRFLVRKDMESGGGTAAGGIVSLFQTGGLNILV